MSGGPLLAMARTGETSSASDKSIARVFARGVAWNLAGLVLPLPIGLIAFPLIASHLDEFRFGLLTAVWSVMGYFALFDFGVARALTRELSMTAGTADSRTATSLIHTATVLSLAFGVVGAGLLCAVSPLLVDMLGADRPIARTEIFWTIILASALLPLLLLVTVAQAVLEAMQRFRDLAVLRFPLTTATYLAPLAVLPFSPNVPMVVAALVAARLIILAVFWWIAARTSLPRMGLRAFNAASARSLLVQGGWMTVTNLVSPILVYLDRWLVAALASVAALGYYSVPMELGQRLLVIAAAIAGVMFPVFAREGGNSAQSLSGYRQSTAAVVMSVLPIALIVGGWTVELLDLWMGAEFARQSAVTLQIVLAGILLNSVARIPFTLLQSAGKAQTTALIHVLELPVYVVAAWMLVSSYGLVGAATAWTFRISVDLVLMLVATARLSSELARASVRIGVVVFVALMWYGGLIWWDSMLARMVALISGTTMTGIVVWRYLLSAADRSMVLRLIPIDALQRRLARRTERMSPHE